MHEFHESIGLSCKKIYDHDTSDGHVSKPLNYTYQNV